MNGKCKYLKQKLNHSFECKRNKKTINIKECSNCKLKEYKKKPPSANIKKRSYKLAKLERNRFSVFTKDLEHCILCGKKKEHLHEIFFGSNRKNSIECGFVIPLCSECHSEMHKNHDWQDFWHKKGQLYFEKNIGSRDDFIRLFGKSGL